MDTVKDRESLSEEIRSKSLDASVKDGVAYSVMQGFGERNIPQYSIFIGASEGAYGVTVAAQHLLAGLAQVLGANIVDRFRKRKFYFIIGAIVQAFSWGILLLSMHCEYPLNIAFLLISQVGYLGSLNFTIPPWHSVMGDLVHEEKRGRFFGFRNFCVGAGLFISFVGSAIVLDYLKPLGMLYEGFFALFILCFLFRMISVHYLTKMHEPNYKIQSSDYFGVIDFVKKAPQANFGRFVFYVTMIYFGVAIAGCFFSYYMLKNLHWSFTEYMIGINIQHVVMFACAPLWGRIADKHGNKIVMAIGGIGISLIPALWLISSNKFYIYSVQFYDGLVWSAFNLSTWNYIYDAVTPPKRARCAAYYHLFANVGICSGALLGSYLSTVIPNNFQFAGIQFMFPFYGLLLVSGFFRFLPNLLLLSSFRELRVKLN